MTSTHSTIMPTAGDVYATPADGGGFTLVKVLAVDQFGVHVRCSDDVFATPPQSIDTSTLSWFLGHIPLAHDTWSEMTRELIQTEPVLPDELEGYEMWRNDSGGYFT